MQKAKGVKTIIILILILMFSNINSYAMALNVRNNYETQSVNSEFEYKIDLEEKIVATDFIIEYDENKVELIEIKTENAEYTKISKGKAVVLYYDAEGKGTDNIVIKFKTREVLTENTKSQIKLSNINGYSLDKNEEYKSGNLDLSKTTKTIEITKTNDQANNNSNNVNSNNNNVTIDNNQREEKIESSGEATGVLPQTGTTVNVLIILAVVIFIIVQVFLVKELKTGKNILPLFIIGFILSGTIISNANTTKSNEIYVKAYEKILNHEKIIVVMPDITNRNVKIKDIVSRISQNVKVKKVTDANNNELKEESLISTGNIIELEDGRKYQLVVYGDVNCDGEVNSIDLGMILKNNKENKWTSLTKKAANLNNTNDKKDEIINNLDIEIFKQFILYKLDSNLVKELPSELVERIEIVNPKVKMNKGETQQLQVKLMPDDKIITNIVWTSSNNNVVKVDEKGTITALTAGKETITVKSIENPNLQTQVTIEVSVPVTSVKLNKNEIKIDKNETAKLTATVLPQDAINKKVSWLSSNSNVVKVNNKGEITPVNIGKATITVKTVDGNYTDKCQVEVVENVKVESIALNKKETTIAINEVSTEQLSAIITPTYASNKKVIWTSSNTSVATVNSNGVVTAKQEGETTITATTQDGNKTTTCKVTVISKVKGITLDKNTANLGINTQMQLTATITPTNATNKSVIWTSSNTTVATVDNTGLVTTKQAGQTTITVKTTDGNKIATCNVTVVARVEGVTLNKTSTKILEGQTETLIASITPVNATNKTIVWSSSDTNIATVDDKGIITAKNSGVATITATTQEGQFKSSCTVTVYETTAPNVYITSSRDKGSEINKVILAGETVEYKININEKNVQNIDTSKINVTDFEKNGQNGKINSAVISQDKKYVLLSVTYGKEIKDLGYFNIVIKPGFVTDKSGNTNAELKECYYVTDLNITTNEESIGATVSVANSFYIHHYSYWLDSNLKSEAERTTNEYIYKGLKENTTYTLRIYVIYYLNKETNETRTGFIEKQVTTKANNGVEVHFIDVIKDGQAADSLFIKTANGKTILIDTATSDLERSNMIDTYLRTGKHSSDGKNLVTAKDGVVTIDYLMITHTDEDHIGGFGNLTGVVYKDNNDGYKEGSAKLSSEVKYKFKNIIIPCTLSTPSIKDDSSDDTKAIYAFIKYAKANSNLIKVTAGNSLAIDNCVLNIFYPYPYNDVPKDLLSTTDGSGGIRKGAQYYIADGSTQTYSHRIKNNTSVVTKLICGSRKMLLTGDAEFLVEEILLGKVNKEITSDSKGLLIHSSNSYTNSDSLKMKKYISLVQDMIDNNDKYKDIKTASNVENKYKLSRLTAKDISAQVLKKGHHGVENSTSIDFLKMVKPNKIVSTGKSDYNNSLIKSVGLTPDYRIREYYKSGESGSTTVNGKNLTTKGDTAWYRSVFSADGIEGGGFYIKTSNGKEWSYSAAYNKMEKAFST